MSKELEKRVKELEDKEKGRIVTQEERDGLVEWMKDKGPWPFKEGEK